MTAKEFTDIYLPLHDSVYRVAFFLLGSRQDAEDAVQDLYIKLWNSRSSLAEIKNPKNWCITLIRNICIDRIRKTAKGTETELTEASAYCRPADTATLGKEALLQVAKVFRHLPERQQKVLRMKVSEELSNEEIARKTGMSNLTVRVLLSQARKTLRKCSEER